MLTSVRRAVPRVPFDHGEPIRSLSPLPLAGVMLIAATLVALTYPAQTHAITVDLPLPLYPGEIEPLSPPENRLGISRSGRLSWNAEAVNSRELREILSQTREAVPQPALKFEPDADASYASVVRTLALIRSAGLIDHCFRFGDLPRFARYELQDQTSEPVAAMRRGCDFIAPM